MRIKNQLLAALGCMALSCLVVAAMAEPEVVNNGSIVIETEVGSQVKVRQGRNARAINDNNAEGMNQESGSIALGGERLEVCSKREGCVGVVDSTDSEDEDSLLWNESFDWE
jgi:hypothetical protein